jgi:hypothetical protein
MITPPLDPMRLARTFDPESIAHPLDQARAEWRAADAIDSIGPACRDHALADERADRAHRPRTRAAPSNAAERAALFGVARRFYATALFDLLVDCRSGIAGHARVDDMAGVRRAAPASSAKSRVARGLLRGVA